MELALGKYAVPAPTVAEIDELMGLDEGTPPRKSEEIRHTIFELLMVIVDQEPPKLGTKHFSQDMVQFIDMCLQVSQIKLENKLIFCHSENPTTVPHWSNSSPATSSAPIAISKLPPSRHSSPRRSRDLPPLSFSLPLSILPSRNRLHINTATLNQKTNNTNVYMYRTKTTHPCAPLHFSEYLSLILFYF